ncbi:MULTISPECIES: ribonuclease HI family protein [unclassified Duganella]|uniref:ribonuclease HI family protein n=1 Tax=unclassified Duganella TaxID=2636909 RepID=UPI00087FD357|nr:MULTISPECIES: ribonuclease HI family protein [unclassified Duganella]SDF62838.1 ribonuclease HI [Duganella sp. OV458]SDI65610.1 ribonuclease HI [Duganella sp. OV510]
MDNSEFEMLATAAFKGERVAARRLAARTQVSEAQALLQVLSLAAGALGLAQLLAERQALRQRDEERRAGRQADAAHKLAQRKAGMQATAAWRGWFDGSAHPNPGRIGIGALLCGPDGQRVEISRRAGHGNSSEAEYLALTALLEAAREMGATELAVHGDSQVVINDVNLYAARGAKGLEEHRARVMALMAALGAVNLRWVPRHRNGDADRLSQQAIGQPD